MEVFNNKGECCGCGLCTTVCKKNAIVMKEDSKGFIYPEINEELCIQCGMCTKICSYNSEEIFNTPIESYAALTKNKRVLSKSAFLQQSQSSLSNQEDGFVDLLWSLKRE